jgi:hypothetical protein
MRKPTKKKFLLMFTCTVAVLALIRPLVDKVGQGNGDEAAGLTYQESSVPTSRKPVRVAHDSSYHRILSVPNYREAFPDSQSVQIVAANRWGVRPVRNREDAEERKQELVYVGESPYYHVDRLSSSIPYLVPRAALLLNDIGEAFYDSLYQKGVPLHQMIVTSILRTMDDVSRLQRHNGNATENSCHLYGTTVDICYNRYQALGREVNNDTLKWVLSEVLRDKRQENRCYIKYEVKQGCFHMTVR